MPNSNINRNVVLPTVQNPVVVGQIFANDYASAGWTSAGASTTWTFNSNNITSVGTAGAITNYIRYNKWTLQSERFTIKALVTIDSVGAADKWFGVGLAGVSTSSSATNFQCAYWAEAGANNGLTTIYNWNGTQVATSGAARITSVVGDQIEYTVTFEYNTITFSVRNMAAPNTVQTISWTNSTAFVYPGGVTTLLPNINQVAFNNFYGSYTVNTFNYTDNEYKNNYLVVIGDSKSEGYYVDTFANRFSNLIGWKTSGIVQVAAGSGNVTQDIVNGLNEILIKKPKYAMMVIGRNDIANGVAAGTWQANYLNIATQLERAGTKVYHQLPLTEAVLDQSALATYISATFPSTRVIPVPSGWNVSTDVNADGVHLSIQGADKVYLNALNYIPAINGGYRPPLQSNLQTWYDALSVKPTQTLLNDLNDLFQGMENDGDLTETDFVHPYGGLETNEQRLAPIKTTGTSPMTAVNSPTVDANGFTGNGTTSYINTNYNPATNGVKYTQDLASIGIYNRTNRAANTSGICGASTLSGTVKLTRIYPRYTGNVAIYSVNAATESFDTNSSSHGYFLAVRTALNLTTGYRNGTSFGTETDTSSALLSANFFICGVNNGGAILDPTTDNSAFFIVGGSVSASRTYYRVQKYMTARGINV